VALVNNKSFTEKQSYPDSVVLAIENQNIGCGFGAHLRTLRYLQARSVLAPDARIMFLNDSVIYLPGHEEVFAKFAEQEAGWVRFKPAADWLAQHQRGPQPPAPTTSESGFDQFLAQRGVPHLTPAQREATWEYFQSRMRGGTASR
jgi:hypothetical protein